MSVGRVILSIYRDDNADYGGNFNYEKNERVIAVATIIELATIWQKDATFRGWVCVIN